MAELGAVYASALFELFMETLAELPEMSPRKEVEEGFLAQVVLLKDVLGEPECKSVMAHPLISGAEKQAFLRQALDGKIHADLMGFLSLAVTKNRETYIVPALGKLVDLIEKYQRKTTAKVISAGALDDAQSEALRAMLASKLNKQVELELMVDPSVIGGVNIYVDGYFIDRTLKKKLREMRENVKLTTAMLGSQ